MPDNFLILPTSDVTGSRIDTLVNARHTTDLDLTVEGLSNGQELTVYRLSDGVSGTPVAVVKSPVTLTVDDPAFVDFPVVVSPDLQTVPIALSGMIEGSVSALEGRLVRPNMSVVQDWTQLQSLRVTGASWTADLVAAPGPERYLVQLRAVGQTQSVTQTIPFVTAGVLASYGQSNTVFFSSTPDADVSARSDVFHLQGGVYGAPTGGGMTTLLNELAAATGIAWVGITGGAGGVAIQILDNTITGGLDDDRDQIDGLLADIAITGRRPTLAVFHQGEGDAPIAGGETLAQYEASWDNIWDTVAQAYPEETTPFPKFIVSLGTQGEGLNPLGWSTVDSWHLELVETKSDVYWGGSWKDARRNDLYHGYGSDYTRRAKRTAEHIKDYFDLVPDFQPFKITGAEIINATTTDVTVAHGQGTAMAILEVIEQQEAFGANTTVARGFDVSGSGAYVAATGSIVDATTIRLTHVDIGTASRTLRYLYGAKPDTSGLVIDNSGAEVPLLHTGITPIVASGATATAEFAQQAFEVASDTLAFTATGLLAGAERFLYTVQINRDRDLAFTNGGVAVTPLVDIDVPVSDGNGNVLGTDINRLFVFEVATLAEIGITVTGGNFANNSFGVTLTEAKGTSGAWSVLDTVVRLPVDRFDNTITHAPLTIPDGDIVTGFYLGDPTPDNATAWVSTTYEAYNLASGSTVGVVGTSLASGAESIYSVSLTRFRIRLAGIIATISARA